MSRSALRTAFIVSSAAAAVGSLFAGMWLVFGLGWALIAMSGAFVGLTVLAWSLVPDEPAPTDKPSSPIAAAPSIPPPALRPVAPIITPRDRVDA